MSKIELMDVPIEGMDCAECTLHVQKSIAGLPGVEGVEVFLGAEKAVVRLDPERVGLPAIRQAVEQAGYAVPDQADRAERKPEAGFTRSILGLLGVVFGAVLFVVVIGEWLGLFEAVGAQLPWPVSLAIVLAAGYPVFRNVVRAATRGRVISHSLMTLGVIAAIAVGEWASAVVVVFFMRVGDYVERFTAERARRAVRDLSALAPRKARLVRRGEELEVPIDEVGRGDLIVVRPGEMIPVDGQVVSGQATVNQASITGESQPVEAGPGAFVYAATLLVLGSLRVKVEAVGADTTFGKVIRLVEEAESNRAEVQRIADRFSAYYLPVVAGIAALTLLIRRDPVATAAVLVVACSCSFALATPIAMLASIGAGARSGVMIKGGKYLELLAKADVLLIDKTGTLTLGKPRIVKTRFFEAVQISGDGAESRETDIRSGGSGHNGLEPEEVLRLAASAERYSEHPLAEALRIAALEQGLALQEPDQFESIPGLGVRARVDGHSVWVGNRRMMEEAGDGPVRIEADGGGRQAPGFSRLYAAVDGRLAGLFLAEDTPRPEVPEALRQVRGLGIRQIEILTGDNELAARQLVCSFGPDLELAVRANLLPEDKIRIVREYQAQGHIVVMVGDGVNDAPALAQADVGIALRSGGAAGSDLAVEAAHIALMRDDWRLVPEVMRMARRTLRVVKMNIAFTTIYNVAGLTLAAFGYLPPVLAAAAQSLPDLGILANSSRLLRQKP